jgi:hypothetical protein
MWNCIAGRRPADPLRALNKQFLLRFDFLDRGLYPVPELLFELKASFVLEPDLGL